MVALERCESYQHDELAGCIRRAIDALGGMGRFVRPGQKVLLKPNLLSPAAAARAVTTHPAVVEAVIDLVGAAGGQPFLGDSPGLSSLRRVAQSCGIAQVARRRGVPVVPFGESVVVPAAEGQLFRQIEIARAVVDADVVISLPKVKTHGQMLLTLAIKNLFGCVVGRRKAQWHLRAGLNHDLFARLLVDVCRAARPALHVADAVVAMDGNGPGSGDPIRLGFIAASADAVALDAVIGSVLGVRPERVPTTRTAAKLGLGTGELGRIELRGADPGDVKVPRFRLPRIEPAVFVPLWLARRVRNRLRPRPVVVQERCELCGVCVQVCPVAAMRLADRVVIDERRCISCMCCQELCPHGAIEIRRGWLSSVLFR